MRRVTSMSAHATPLVQFRQFRAPRLSNESDKRFTEHAFREFIRRSSVSTMITILIIGIFSIILA